MNKKGELRIPIISSFSKPSRNLENTLTISPTFSIKMNRQYKKYPKESLPFRIDSFEGNKKIGYEAEYDGWHFEGRSIKVVVNQILKYIFNGGEE